MFRFCVVSEQHGLVATAHTPEEAEHVAVLAAIGTGRTVYLHDRLTELTA